MPHGAIARMENCPAQAVRKMVARQLADRRIDPAGDFARRRSATPLRPARDKFASQAFENAGAVDGMSGSRGVMRDLLVRATPPRRRQVKANARALVPGYAAPSRRCGPSGDGDHRDGVARSSPARGEKNSAPGDFMGAA
jgi:hypothetical protein